MECQWERICYHNSMMTIEERIKYYFGSFYNRKLSIEVDRSLYDFKINEPFFYKGSDSPDYIDDPRFNPCFWFKHPEFCIKIPCIAISSDGYNNRGLPAFTKARSIGIKNNGILMKLNIPRHWSILDNPPRDIPWEDKISDVVWRGNHVCGDKKKPNRFDLVEKYGTKHNIKFWSGDINKYCDGQQRYYYEHKHLFAEKLMPQCDQLRYKYIVSMEGNDVGTGLKWILNSNSVAIMPKPQIESWLMEGLLVPWKHYIPLDDNVSNLDEILHWCKTHDRECQNIVKNANSWMSQFKNLSDEKYIFDSIIDQYSKNIEFCHG